MDIFLSLTWISQKIPSFGPTVLYLNASKWLVKHFLRCVKRKKNIENPDFRSFTCRNTSSKTAIYHTMFTNEKVYKYEMLFVINFSICSPPFKKKRGRINVISLEMREAINCHIRLLFDHFDIKENPFNIIICNGIHRFNVTLFY